MSRHQVAEERESAASRIPEKEFTSKVKGEKEENVGLARASLIREGKQQSTVQKEEGKEKGASSRGKELLFGRRNGHQARHGSGTVKKNSRLHSFKGRQKEEGRKRGLGGRILHLSGEKERKENETFDLYEKIAVKEAPESSWDGGWMDEGDYARV